jgi:heme oxygenase
MSRLREETQPHHTHAESRPLEQALAHGQISPALYAAYLAQRLPIHARLEAHMRQLAARDARFGRFLSDDLYQEANLKRDLEHLQRHLEAHAPPVPPAAQPPLPAATHLLATLEQAAADHPVALLGAYYVFEGSKNGGRYIARSIARSLGLQPGPGLLYLDPHGEEQRARWLSFRSAVDAEEWTTPEMDAAVAMAKQTFDAISNLDDELWAP